MIYHDVVQNSDEWFELRKGKVTTSKLGVIMANFGKPFGNPAKEYALRIVLEQYKNERITDSFSNGWMKRGHELEPIAIDKYQYETFNKVSNGGFCQSEKFDFVGGSPDGLILLDKGGIEVKCPKYTTHYATIKRNAFDPSYKWQLLGNMWLCDLEYIDFISYCPDFTKNKELFINRLHKNDYKNELQAIEERLSEFEVYINKLKNELR